MVLESTMVCVDNSDFMRNGDFIPTRLQAQQDAVSLVCHSKARSNPENNVGLVVMSSVEVLVTLTSEVGRILSKLHQVQPKGEISFITAVRVAHLALKHRQGRNHKLRIIVFVGSPVEDEEKELIKLAKKLKKEKVNVDVVNFGEEHINTDKLTTFINTINGKEGTSSNLVTVSPGPMLSDALLSSPIVMGEDGTGVVAGMGGSFEFGVDPNEDPELALALRVSMEEQRARQEDEARKVAASTTTTTTPAAKGGTVEEESLEQAIAMSLNPDETETMEVAKDYSEMTEEEQIALALQMSMQASAEESEATPMDTDDAKAKASGAAKDDGKSEEEDFMNDPAFLQSVLSNLPGVDPQSEAIRNAMNVLTDSKKEDSKKDDSKKDDKSKDKK